MPVVHSGRLILAHVILLSVSLLLLTTNLELILFLFVDTVSSGFGRFILDVTFGLSLKGSPV